MKVIDFDGLFDEKIAIYMKQNKKKRSAKNWEDAIPKLYKQFGDTYIAKIKCTPKQYYANLSDVELVDVLSAHLEGKISIPEFMRAELEKRALTALLLPLLRQPYGGEVLELIDDHSNVLDSYFALLFEENVEESVKNGLLDVLRENAEVVKESASEMLAKGREKEYMLELLSRTALGDDRVYSALLQAFLQAEDGLLPRRANALARYGDERALPYLLDKIEDESLGFVEFQELKYAIEALGGEYTEERDFSTDKDYVRVMVAGEKENH